MKSNQKNLQEEYLSILRAVENHFRNAQSSGEILLQQVTESAGTGHPAGKKESSFTTLNEILEAMGDCRRCKLYSTRTHLVFGTGNPKPDLLFVGEGPGEEEDLQGKPFVGRAGQLLTKMIEAMGLTRDDVYITNIVKSRPPGNRNPEPDEIAACFPFLKAQIDVLKPKVICTLGTFASQTLLKTEEKISRMRGRFHDYGGIKLMPTYHPAYLLRNPGEKKTVWEDIQMIMKELGLEHPQKEGVKK